MFECKLISFRGRLEAAAEVELNQLGAEGWEVVTAYPVADAGSSMITHQFVLRRGAGSRRK